MILHHLTYLLRENIYTLNLDHEKIFFILEEQIEHYDQEQTL